MRERERRTRATCISPRKYEHMQITIETSKRGKMEMSKFERLPNTNNNVIQGNILLQVFTSAFFSVYHSLVREMVKRKTIMMKTGKIHTTILDLNLNK